MFSTFTQGAKQRIFDLYNLSKIPSGFTSFSQFGESVPSKRGFLSRR
jgi:hypothetical protein